MANLESLKGKTITDIISEDGFQGLVFQSNEQKTIAWIQADPEGNSPGFLNIQEESQTTYPTGPE